MPDTASAEELLGQQLALDDYSPVRFGGRVLRAVKEVAHGEAGERRRVAEGSRRGEGRGEHVVIGFFAPKVLAERWGECRELTRHQYSIRPRHHCSSLLSVVASI